jgi:flagellar biosynthesis chaperone FliJ
MDVVKRYSNRLQRVLDVRRILEDRARQEVLRAQQDLRNDELHESRCRQSYENRENIVGPVGALVHLSDRAAYELEGLAVQHAAARVEQDKVVVDERLGVWSAAARRVEALERLDARRREEHAVEVDCEAAKEVDDLVSGRAARAAAARAALARRDVPRAELGRAELGRAELGRVEAVSS